ncbi:MAG: UvrD-helicase domain-containing protein [Patescibacteria group bacterium]
MANLNKKQKEAVDYLGGPLLIAAGAGSGKTKTLTSRLFSLIKSGILPENIIAITFTNKAADEMRKRIMSHEEEINSDKPERHNSKFIIQNLPFIGTFHSLGARILKKEAKFFGRNSNFSIFDEDDSLRLIKMVIKNFNLAEKDSRKITPILLRRDFSRIKNELADVEGEDFENFYKEYELALKQNNAFDFDDLIEKPVRLFKNHPEILEKYQNQFQYILVDEFQDTNVSQYAFIKFLAQKHKNLSVVGDDQQSIYKFRGSDFRNFLNFEKDWPQTKVILLEQNYRSAGNIIKAASAVIEKNKYQKPKKLWTENSEGDLIKVVEHNDEADEAEYVSSEIENLKRGNADSSIGILYRTNAQSRAIESALIEKGVAYKIFGGLRFYERKEIKDVVAMLRWGANPRDSVSLERLKKNFTKKTFLEIERGLPEAAKKLQPVALISKALEISDYFANLKKNFLNFEERIENINELVYFASGFNDLSEFLERISLLQASDLIREEENTKKITRVNLMSIHLSKGLEFDNVFLIGCNEGLMPHQMSYYSEEEIEEERRLMYVAMTRAKKELCINFYHIPSRFLYEIPPELVKFSGERSLGDEERYIIEF